MTRSIIGYDDAGACRFHVSRAGAWTKGQTYRDGSRYSILDRVTLLRHYVRTRLDVWDWCLRQLAKPKEGAGDEPAVSH